MGETVNLLALWGAAALGMALWALLADRRRMRRRNPDAVGFMPWTGVFFTALLLAVMLLGIAGKMWLAG